MLLTVRGTDIYVDKELLEKSPYFKVLLAKAEIGEIDNDPDEFLHFLEYLKGDETNPGPLGDFYLGKPCIPLLHENYIEWANEPLLIPHYKIFDTTFLLWTSETMYGMTYQDSHVVNQSSKMAEVDGNTISFVLPCNKNITWAENFKFVTNRRIKHIKIHFIHREGYASLCIFDEPDHKYLDENLSKTMTCIYNCHKRQYLYFEVELYDGTFDPWLQIILDGVLVQHSNWIRLLQWKSTDFRLTIDNKTRCSFFLRENDSVEEKIPIMNENSIIHINTDYKHYLGCIEEIEDVETGDMYLFGSDVVVSLMLPSGISPYVAMNHFNDYWLYINYNCNRIDNGHKLHLSKKVSVWKVGSRCRVYKYDF